jgi:hypothetical protein
MKAKENGTESEKQGEGNQERKQGEASRSLREDACGSDLAAVLGHD